MSMAVRKRIAAVRQNRADAAARSANTSRARLRFRRRMELVARAFMIPAVMDRPIREDVSFDVTGTPTVNGAIPETFRKMAGVTRSWHPTHALAAWGLDAERYVRHHHRTLTMGEGLPLRLLEQDGGLGLLLGVDYSVNTFKHVVETTNHVPCLGYRMEAYPMRLPDGRVVEGRVWAWRAGSCPLLDPNRHVDQAMRERGLDRRTRIGAADVICYKLSDGRTVMEEMLHNGWAGNPSCRLCPIRPRRGPCRTETDWDVAAGRLKADSEAWRY